MYNLQLLAAGAILLRHLMPVWATLFPYLLSYHMGGQDTGMAGSNHISVMIRSTGFSHFEVCQLVCSRDERYARRPMNMHTVRMKL